MSLPDMKLVCIEAAHECAVEIDGVFAGTSPVCITMPAQRLFLRVSPLYGCGAPLCRMIDLSDTPCVEKDDGLVTLEFGPGGVVCVRVTFAQAAPERLPYMIASAELTALGRVLRASVYFDRAAALALQEPSGRVVFALPLDEVPERAAFFVRQIGNEAYILCELTLNAHKRLVCAGPAGRPVLCFEEGVESWEMRDNGVTLHANTADPCGRCRIKRYFVREGKWACDTGGVTAAVRAAQNGGEALLSLAAAVKESAQAWAMELIHPSLAGQLGFEDIKGFFGEFASARSDAGGELTLCTPLGRGVFAVRVFTAEMYDGLIANIAEKE